MHIIKVKELKTWKEKMMGLLFKKEPKAVLMKTRFGIHTFGMRFPLDILVLDNEQKVVKLKESLKPNRIFMWHPLFDTILELPEKTIQREKIQHGSHILLETQQ